MEQMSCEWNGLQGSAIAVWRQRMAEVSKQCRIAASCSCRRSLHPNICPRTVRTPFFSPQPFSCCCCCTFIPAFDSQNASAAHSTRRRCCWCSSIYYTLSSHISKQAASWPCCCYIHCPPLIIPPSYPPPPTPFSYPPCLFLALLRHGPVSACAMVCLLPTVTPRIPLVSHRRPRPLQPSSQPHLPSPATLIPTSSATCACTALTRPPLHSLAASLLSHCTQHPSRRRYPALRQQLLPTCPHCSHCSTPYSTPHRPPHYPPRCTGMLIVCSFSRSPSTSTTTSLWSY